MFSLCGRKKLKKVLRRQFNQRQYALATVKVSTVANSKNVSNIVSVCNSLVRSPNPKAEDVNVCVDI